MRRKSTILKKLRLEVKRANQRLVRLERAFGEGKWGAKRLEATLNIDSLNAWTEKGRVKFNKNMSKKDLEIIERAVGEFLNKKELSTVSGVKKRIKRLKEGVKETFDVDESLADEIYNYFDNDNFKYLKGYFKVDSDAINTILEAKEKHYSLEKFEDKIKEVVEYSNDSWLKDKIIGVYNDLIL